MLTSRLIHPPLQSALGRSGHTSRVLIADANFPHATKRGPRAELIHLNVMPGLISSPQALEAVLSAVPIEAAAVMQYHTDGPYAMSEDPPIWTEFRQLLDAADFKEPMARHERFDFYDKACGPDVAVTIATGEQRLYANILLDIGVIFPD
jgi:L-fucose mutarotase